MAWGAFVPPLFNNRLVDGTAMSMSMLEAQIRRTLDLLSNNEPVEYDDQWVEDAGEMFKDALRKQLSGRENDFRLRMSNIGRPSCQLQMEKAGAERTRMPYNHIMRMMLGDAVECIMEVILRVSGANITGGKSQAEFNIADTTINGEDDIEIDDKVYDTKSASPWAYDNKWSEGWHGLAKDDAFGYTAQLLGYSQGLGKQPGGWIVVNKSTGEVRVVDACPSEDEVKKINEQVTQTIQKITSDAPFERCFAPVDEYFRSKPTGNKRLSNSCSFCSYVAECWPDAVYKPQAMSQAKNPKYYWYTEYKTTEEPK